MIPYCIQYASAVEDPRDNNIFITNDCCKREKLNTTIISIIIQFMYEFCSEDYGHGITISSYDDFCQKYWQFQGFQVRGWYWIFHIVYFDDNSWIEWKMEDYTKAIFNAYQDKYYNN
jgi:hypothetical protein